jgi:hypothetical protein
MWGWCPHGGGVPSRHSTCLDRGGHPALQLVTAMLAAAMHGSTWPVVMTSEWSWALATVLAVPLIGACRCSWPRRHLPSTSNRRS